MGAKLWKLFTFPKFPNLFFFLATFIKNTGMAKSIILTADDYGACKFIDDGIKRALDAGKLNTVTVFVTHPGSRASIQQLIEFRRVLQAKGRSFNIGLHFSLTSGSPLAGGVATLATGGENETRFFREAKHYPFESINLDEMERELISQLNRLSAILGDEPIDHVTNHHGVVYLDTQMFERYVLTIKKYASRDALKYPKGIPIRSPMSWQRTDNAFLDCDKSFKTPVVRQGLSLGYWKRFREVTEDAIARREKIARDAAVKFPDCLADTIYGQPYPQNVIFLLQQYKNREFNSEFMFHLGYDERAESQSVGSFLSSIEVPHGIDRNYFPNRFSELDVLLSLDLDYLLRSSKISTINYSGL
jgi:predicted glycoside hydrolase/deacetylase ChbG (UPF0249 family)